MIFISYRHEDSASAVTHLRRRLAERFGDDRVFVDYRDIPAGEVWPELLKRRVEASRVLLVIVGPSWGEARFKDGENEGRLRLDDPDDWVRREICQAVASDGTLVIVVLIENAKLPHRKWRCELDRLHLLQSVRIRNQDDFDTDFERLCGSLEVQVPELRNLGPAGGDNATTGLDQRLVHEVQRYLSSELRTVAVLQLPLFSPTGVPVVAPMDRLRIDLPLIVSHQRALPVARLLWLGSGVEVIHDQLRSTHTSAVLVDRASRFEDLRRDCGVGERLAPGSRLAVVGDPGSGKSTLLQWLAQHYGSRFSFQAPPAQLDREGSQPNLPAQNWLPIMILCRELAGQALPDRLEDLLRAHLRSRLYSDAVIESLVPCFESMLEAGQVILLVDGLDEIPNLELRMGFARLLATIANRFSEAPIVVTSRVIGFQAVCHELAATYDHFVVAPLDRAAKQSFVHRWAALVGWKPDEVSALLHQVCHRRTTAKLTESILLLAMVAQLQTGDGALPGRRVDIYRRAVELMILQRRQFMGPALSLNELIPHLEYLAYSMRRKGLQRIRQPDAVAVFDELRALEPDEAILRSRPPEELLRACIDSIGILNVAGSEVDERGYERYMVQFVHQSFQEYFTGQALKYRLDGTVRSAPVQNLRALLASLAIGTRETQIVHDYKVTEPVLADYWQDSVRLAIADLGPQEASDAITMLLPTVATQRSEARARAVFALQCLADEPAIDEQTVGSVLDSAVDNLWEDDGFDTKLHTGMDEALAAVAESAFAQRASDRMLEEYIQARDEQRGHAGRCFCLGISAEPVTAENVGSVLAHARAGLAANGAPERVRTALELMNRFFATKSLGSLPAEPRQSLVKVLVESFVKDEATRGAAVWALSHLTGASDREPGITPADLRAKHVLLDASQVQLVEEALRSTENDSATIAGACLLLTREEGLALVVHQHDWVYDLALVADGQKPRSSLAKAGPTGRTRDLEWVRAWLSKPLRQRSRSLVAVALGSLGVLVPEMVGPLCSRFLDERATKDARDEAMLYLALIGTPEALDVLTQAAEAAATEEYLCGRGLFGLILADDPQALAERLRNGQLHSDHNSYAFALASSCHPQGPALLAELKQHHDERVRDAVATAYAAPWVHSSGVELPDARAWNTFGLALTRRKRLDEALRAHGRALELEPGHLDSRLGLGDVQLGLRQLEAAEASARTALGLDGASAKAWNFMGRVQYAKPDLGAALEAFMAATELVPTEAVYAHNVAIVQNARGQFEEAERWGRRAVELNPQYIAGWIAIGVALNKQTRFDEAAVAYRQAVELAPEDIGARRVLAVLERGLGRLDEAEKLGRKTVKLAPADAAHHHELGLTLQEAGKVEDALAMFSKATELAPTDPSYQQSLASLRQQLN